MEKSSCCHLKKDLEGRNLELLRVGEEELLRLGGRELETQEGTAMTHVSRF